LSIKDNIFYIKEELLHILVGFMGIGVCFKGAAEPNDFSYWHDVIEHTELQLYLRPIVHTIVYHKLPIHASYLYFYLFWINLNSSNTSRNSREFNWKNILLSMLEYRDHGRIQHLQRTILLRLLKEQHVFEEGDISLANNQQR